MSNKIIDPQPLHQIGSEGQNPAAIQADTSSLASPDAPPVTDTSPGSPPIPLLRPQTWQTLQAVGGVPVPACTPATVFSQTGPDEGGEGGEGGEVDAPTSLQVTNAEFIAALYPQVTEGASVAVCSKRGNPEEGGWIPQRAGNVDEQCPINNNNYVCGSTLYSGESDSFKVRKAQFADCRVLVLDDIGGKIQIGRLGEFKPTYLIETSPGNYQAGILLKEPINDGELATQLHNALIDAGYCDPGANGPMNRWMRLPVGINGKSKHSDADGNAFQCRIVQWNPKKRYTVDELVVELKLTLTPAQKSRPGAKTSSRNGQLGDEVFIPKLDLNPVVAALSNRGLYKKPLGSGKHDITCPWAHEHTDGMDSGTAYFEPDEHYTLGGFCCKHSHGEKYHISQLLEYLNIARVEARHKAIIRIIAGDLHRIVDVAEAELAKLGQHFQYGGMIVSISTDPVTGDPTIVITSIQTLTKIMSVIVIWEKFDGRSKEWERNDPPVRHLSILQESKEYRHLPVLAGLARQPYFRESDGKLVTSAGYDSGSQLFGVFDHREFVTSEPTLENARHAMAMLEDLLFEFHFVAPTDKAAALSAIFTAVVRLSLEHAPAYHAKAPVFGSGKTYLCEVIGAFGGPGGNRKVSYPTTSEEATKAILALLLTSPAVIEFDDMDTDWIPHGVIKRMLTTDKITDRILGVSKTATVSTRTLFLGSGNNVGPVRDLLRRVLTIHIDPRCATPATLTYTGNPVEKVRKNRSAYVAAVLTIILAWRQAGSPRAPVQSIVTYSGAWSEYCRYPLMWLGHPDPATSLLTQVTHDPDSDSLKSLMAEWEKCFGSTPTTVRKAVDKALHGHGDLLDAMREFPIEERGEINRSKFGWLLKKNANRIVGGFEFQQTEADGRTAWRVIKAAPRSPALPASTGSSPRTVGPSTVEVEL